MGLGDIYRAIEDKYYSAVDWLDAKGLSLYPIIDRIEHRNIPSLPVFVLLALVIVLGIYLLLAAPFAQQGVVSFTVSDAETGDAIEDARVSITGPNDFEASATTGADGKVDVAVPFGKVDVEVYKSAYDRSAFSLDVSGPRAKDVSLSKSMQIITRTVQLMKTGTSQLLEEPVTIRFTCSDPDASAFDETKTSSDGTIELDIPGNCGSLVANPVANFTAPNGIIDISEASPQLFLQAIETNTGTVHVTVENLAGEALAGITVMVYSHDAVIAGTQYTSAAGTAVFDNIPTGTYYIVVHDSQGSYADFDSSMLGEEGLKELVKDQTVYFEASLAEASAGKIKVLVKDSVSQDPVENATVFLKKGSAVVDTEYTAENGTVEFNVTENVAYDLEIDADAYLIALVTGVSAGESFREIYLEPATADNTQVLAVEVVDSRQKPIENVRLVLKKADGTIYANNVVTGSDGKGEFTNLPLDTYYVYAVKKGFEGKNSEPILIKPRQDNVLRILLPIGFGNLEAVVLNDEMQPFQGAIVEAINVLSNDKEQEEITGLEGKAIFNFRADKAVFFKVDAEGFLPYYSIGVMPDADSTVSTTIVLAKDSGQLQVKLVGLYHNSDAALEELAAGSKYRAKLLLLVPKGSRFDEAGIHFRTGLSQEGKTNIMEEDSIYIGDIFASSPNVLRGTSFTPPKGYAVDAANLTTGDSKWANVVWKNVEEGSYALEAEIQVKDSAYMGQLLYLSYRGWGKSGKYTRFPKDDALKGEESTAGKQALYANANQRAFTSGPSNLCGNSFCKTFQIEDIERGLRVNVVNLYNGSLGNTYRLHFLFSSKSEQAFTNSEIEFGSGGDGLRFGSYAITDAVGLRSEGIVEGYSLLKDVGDIKRESSVFGFIDFKTEKEGSNLLSIVIKSNNQPVLTESIDVRVNPAEELNLDIIPKEIIPMVDNLVLLRVTDSNNSPVSNAIATVRIDDTLVISKETNGKGEVQFKLESPASGSTFRIKAEKRGFKATEFEMLIDSQILDVTPPEIREKLDLGYSEIEQQLWFSNQTATDLVVSKLRFSKGFEDMVEFEWDDDYIGEKINADRDINVFLWIRLTEKGLLVDTPQKLEGSLSIHLLSQELQETFVENVPIEIRIGLGNDLDDSKCLGILPVKWEVITSADAPEAQQFILTNNCTVDGSPIPLSSFSARVVDRKGNSLGNFELSSEQLPGSSSIMLGEGFTEFSETLPAEFDGELQIVFTPNILVDSGSAEPRIEFRASHFPRSGEEHTDLALPVELHVSSLSKCIEVVAEEPIIVETMPFNTGYGNYRGSYNPYYAGGYGGYQAGGSGYGGIPGSGGGYLGGSMYPNPNFTSPYYTNYYDRQQDNSWRYGLGESSFIVKNNCSSAVEIDLDIPSRLRVEEDSFELQPDSDRTVRVESGYRMGSYEIDISAKIKGSQDNGQKIGSIDVVVRRQGEIDEECIQLSTTKIRMNDFIGRPVEHEIYNRCYDIGVRLQGGPNTIQFYCRVAGQPMNTYRFEESAKGETAMLQAPSYYEYSNQGYPNYGYNSPSTQPSGSHYTPPNAAGMYSPGEAYAPVGPWGSAYGQAGLGNQGYNYPYGSYPYGSTGWAYPQVGGLRDRCEIIDYVIVTEPYTRGGAEGRTIQTVVFKVKPALNYRKMLCQYMSQSPFQTVFGLRVMLSQSFYRVMIDGSAFVRYYDPFGGVTNQYFQIEIEDLWGIGDTIDECLRNAGQSSVPLERLEKCKEKGITASAQEVVNRDALDLTKKGYNKGFVPQNAFGPEGETFIYEAEPAVLKIPPAGGQDSIVDVIPKEVNDSSGVKLRFEPVEGDCSFVPLLQAGNWNVKMTVDRSQMSPDIGCAKIDTQVTLRISRPTFWDKPKDVTIPVKVWVIHKNADIADIEPDKCAQTPPKPPVGVECPGGGDTGTIVHQTYGFDKLQFDWSWSSIDKDSCDEGNDDHIYCDAVQLSIELNKKGKELAAFVGPTYGFGSSLINKAKVLAVLGTDDEQQLNQFKNSRDLFRWVKEQVIIKDNSVKGTENKLVFFLNGENELLLGEKLAPITEVGIVDGKDPLSEAPELTQAMAAILNKLQTDSSVDQESIVGLFKRNDETDDFEATTFAEMGIELHGELGSYVWTFKEFKAFHDALKMPGVCEDPTAISCEIKEIAATVAGEGTDDKTTVSAGMLKAVFNADLQFVVGVRHTEGLDIDTELGRKVLEEGKDLESLELPAEYANFEEFYNKAIDFNAYLMKDGYSKDLREDFVTAYPEEDEPKDLEFKDKWSFALEGKGEDFVLPDAGLFSVLLDYRFGEGKWVVELKPEKTLGKIEAQYAENVFFELPLDGSVGEGGDGRQGYGTVFTGSSATMPTVAYKQENVDTIITRFIKLGSGASEYTFNYGTTLDKTNSGTILDISGKSFNYNPSKPARVQLELQPRQYGGIEGFLYQVQPAAPQGMEKLFDWKSQTAGTAFKDKKFSVPEASTLCKEVGAEFHGFSEEISAEAKYTGVMFVPLDREYTLQAICVQGSAKMIGLDDAPLNAGHRDGDTAVRLNSVGDAEQRTLAEFISKIASGNVCFSAKADGAELSWYKDKLLQPTS